MEAMTISKQLSANDTGDTGAHQAGILVPKEKNVLLFFPKLDSKTHNPRSHIIFLDKAGKEWEFAFIYYNNRLFGGTRNEYRLTRMTGFIRENGLVPGDEVLLSRNADGEYSVDIHRKKQTSVRRDSEGRTVLQLGGGWRVIQR